MAKRLYYCVLWRHLSEESMTKFVYGDSVKELVDDFLAYGYASMSITDITDLEVDHFDV